MKVAVTHDGRGIGQLGQQLFDSIERRGQLDVVQRRGDAAREAESAVCESSARAFGPVGDGKGMQLELQRHEAVDHLSGLPRCAFRRVEHRDARSVLHDLHREGKQLSGSEEGEDAWCGTSALGTPFLDGGLARAGVGIAWLRVDAHDELVAPFVGENRAFEPHEVDQRGAP